MLDTLNQAKLGNQLLPWHTTLPPHPPTRCYGIPSNPFETREFPNLIYSTNSQKWDMDGHPMLGKALSAAVQDVFFVGEGLFTTVGGRDDW